MWEGGPQMMMWRCVGWRFKQRPPLTDRLKLNRKSVLINMLTAPSPVRHFSLTSLTPFLPSSHPSFPSSCTHLISSDRSALHLFFLTDDIYEGNFCSSLKKRERERERLRCWFVKVFSVCSHFKMLLCRECFEDLSCVCVWHCQMSDVWGDSETWWRLIGPLAVLWGALGAPA